MVKPLTTSHSGAHFFCKLMKDQFGRQLRYVRVLVAGCGDGQEAIYIHDHLQVNVDAIDIWLERGGELPVRDRLHFQECGVLDLPFDNSTFDVVFYHHVIEHVDDPGRSLKELARILKPSGWLFIGTPNRHRLIGNVGAYRRSLKHKIDQNIRDWKMRLQGRFRNEFGAHAGFAQSELDELLIPYFEERHWLTKEYLLFKYRNGLRRLSVQIATAKLWMGISTPSVYAWCRKAVDCESSIQQS